METQKEKEKSGDNHLEALQAKVKSLEEKVETQHNDLVQVANAMGDILQCLGLKMRKKGDDLTFQIVVPANGSQPGVLPRIFSALNKLNGERRIVSPFAKNGPII